MPSEHLHFNQKQRINLDSLIVELREKRRKAAIIFGEIDGYINTLYEHDRLRVKECQEFLDKITDDVFQKKVVDTALAIASELNYPIIELWKKIGVDVTTTDLSKLSSLVPLATSQASQARYSPASARVNLESVYLQNPIIQDCIQFAEDAKFHTSILYINKVLYSCMLGHEITHGEIANKYIFTAKAHRLLLEQQPLNEHSDQTIKETKQAVFSKIDESNPFDSQTLKDNLYNQFLLELFRDSDYVPEFYYLAEIIATLSESERGSYVSVKDEIRRNKNRPSTTLNWYHNHPDFDHGSFISQAVEILFAMYGLAQIAEQKKFVADISWLGTRIRNAIVFNDEVGTAILNSDNKYEYKYSMSPEKIINLLTNEFLEIAQTLNVEVITTDIPNFAKVTELLSDEKNYLYQAVISRTIKSVLK